MVQYLAWSALTNKYNKITLSFLVVSHTKLARDCASHEQNDPNRFNMPKTYKKKQPKIFYRATVVPSESPDVPTPAAVMTASRKS